MAGLKSSYEPWDSGEKIDNEWGCEVASAPKKIQPKTHHPTNA
jgi:hypothetical protein